MKRLDSRVTAANLCCEMMLDAIKKGYVRIGADIVYKYPDIELDCVWGSLLNFDETTDSKIVLKSGVLEKVYMNYCPWCGKKSYDLIQDILKNVKIEGFHEKT